jgi:hypothetical protein
LIPICDDPHVQAAAMRQGVDRRRLDLFLDGLGGALDRLVELPLLLLVGGLPQGLPEVAELATSPSSR